MHIVVDHIEQVTPSVRTVWFKSEKMLRYQAGQFIELSCPQQPVGSQHKKRWFTLSSSPTEELLAITTKFSQPSSQFKDKLLQSLPGEVYTMSEPMGDFILPRSKQRPLLLVAAGIGITPMRSMMTYLRDTGEHRNIECLYAIKNPQEAAFVELLRSVCSRVELFNAADKQRLSTHSVLERVQHLDNPLVYVSGPELMVESLVASLAKEIDQKSLVTDYFPGYQPI